MDDEELASSGERPEGAEAQRLPERHPELLRGMGYSLQSNRKTLEGRQHEDRDAQFHYINDQVKEHLSAGDPVISIDTKKKEMVGDFKNNGREWRPKGMPEDVLVHDFVDPEQGRAVPYGVYDIGANTGWVSVGGDHDTAAFAVNLSRHDFHGEWNYTIAPHLSP